VVSFKCQMQLMLFLSLLCLYKIGEVFTRHLTLLKCISHCLVKFHCQEKISLLCDHCVCEQIQDESHALLMCRDADVCA